MDAEGVRYRTFNVVDDFGILTNAKVTAAIQYCGFATLEQKHIYHVQFAYCSPKELHWSKKRGQEISKLRLMSNDSRRGALTVSLDEKNVGLTNALRSLIMSEAERKHISWAMELAEWNLV